MLRATTTALLATAVAARSVAPPTVVWAYNTSAAESGYWYVGALASGAAPAVLPAVIAAGTYFEGSGAVVDALATDTGRVVRSHKDVTHPCNAWGGSGGSEQHGAVGYLVDAQALNIVYTFDTAKAPWTHQLPGVYFAEGETSCTLRDDTMLVFGQYQSDNASAAAVSLQSDERRRRQRRGRKARHARHARQQRVAAIHSASSADPAPIPNAACMWAVSASTGALTRGPCLTAVGDGEAAETIVASADGRTVLLLAGLQIGVFQRDANADWSTFRTLWMQNSTYQVGTFIVGAMTADAGWLVHDQQGEAHVRVWNATAQTYDLAFVVPTLGNLGVEQVAISALMGAGSGTAPVVAASYTDGGDQSLRFGAAAFDCASPTPWIALWSFVTPPSDGQFTETPSAIAVSEGGEVVAVTSWGDAKQLNAQVHVFRGLGGDGTPLLALHTTGSMCDVTVSVAKGDHGDNGANDSPAALVAAVGLQHHQNQGMLGGHAVAIRVPY